MTLAAIGAGISLVAPTINAFVEAATVVSSTMELFRLGSISQDELLARWKAAGVNVQLADANLQAAMDEARAKGGVS